MAESAFDDQCTGANPRYPLISELKQMYINAFEGTPGKEGQTEENIEKGMH
jgi:acetaldehyde dehydrogenase/alcohol dehydrogenase